MRELLFVPLFACSPPEPSGETDTDPLLEPTDFGFVYVASEPGLGFSDAGAVFRRGLPYAYDCEEHEVEGCIVLLCADEPLAYDPVDLGAIAITGAAAPIELPFADGYAGLFLPDEALFLGGETLSATAPGADGPSFALSLVAPTALTVSDPAWPEGNDSLSVVRADGFAFSWTGATAGTVVANLSNHDQSVSLSCPFPSEDGQAIVPAAALAQIPGGGGFLDIELRSEVTTQIDTWKVRFAASTHALVSPDSPAIASVTLE